MRQQMTSLDESDLVNRRHQFRFDEPVSFELDAGVLRIGSRHGIRHSITHRDGVGGLDFFHHEIGVRLHDATNACDAIAEEFSISGHVLDANF